MFNFFDSVHVVEGEIVYTIKELSEMFDMSASKIRYYEEIGLLENVIHKDKYHRVYDEAHKDRLAAIECFKKARLSLEDMLKFFEYEKDLENNSDKIVAMMKEQEEKTEQELKNMNDGLIHIRKKITYYTAVSDAVNNNDRIPTWGECIKE